MRQTPPGPDTAPGDAPIEAPFLTRHSQASRTARIRRLQAALVAVALLGGAAAAGGAWIRAAKGSSDQAADLEVTLTPSQTTTATSFAPTASGTPSSTSSPSATPTPTATTPSPSNTAEAPAASNTNPPAPPANLAQAVTALEAETGAKLGVVAMAPGGGGTTVSAGTWSGGHAWSTSKVPVAIAALQANPSNTNDGWAVSAITASNNESAVALWNSLGGGDPAGTAAEAVLRSGGDTATTVQRQVTRAGYTAFGQTNWSLANQAVFAANFPTDASAQRVWTLMGQIVSSQRWGLGKFTGAHFKGGWGPDDGRYTVRQFGQIPVGGGCVAVAIGTSAPSFERGTAALSRLADLLSTYSGSLPTGPCR